MTDAPPAEAKAESSADVKKRFEVKKVPGSTIVTAISVPHCET